jgi:phosphate ABC transporter phosphate-binding protein
MGSIVLIVNLPGVADNTLRLTPEVLVDLFLGRITRWTDARLAELNQTLRLPNVPVGVVFRADASGTTAAFTRYMARVSDTWKAGPGTATSVQWPVGQGARGNEGVANTVRNTPGAIGYTENAYATVNRLVTTQLRNKSGNFVKPEMANFTAAASLANWNVPNFAADIIDLSGPDVWPIVTPTFILLPTNPTAERVEGSRNTMRFFDWAFKNGAEAARRLEYIPLPEAVQAHLAAGLEESPKPGDPRLGTPDYRFIATPAMALQAAASAARGLGLTPLILGDALEGEARELGTALAGIARSAAAHGHPLPGPAILLSGGETTVTIRSPKPGRGGRNGECLLGCALALAGTPGIWALMGDTDGIDGSEDNAGAIVTPDTLARARAAGLDPRALLAGHDSYRLFQTLGDLVVTGPTLTNVNDFRALLIA